MSGTEQSVKAKPIDKSKESNKRPRDPETIPDVSPKNKRSFHQLTNLSNKKSAQNLELYKN